LNALASTGSVVVANFVAPEINRLSVALAQRGALRWYVRPYVNKGRRWERGIEAVPRIGGLYTRTLGRRTAPAGLPLQKVIEAGVTRDFLAAMAGRMPLASSAWRGSWSRRFFLAAESAVAVRAGRAAQGANIVVASYGTGKYAFEAVRRAGGRAILSYPIAHNRFQQKLYAEEAAIAPEFAAALPRLNQLPNQYSERLDTECELADRILVGSTFVKQSFIAEGIESHKLIVTPYGVDTECFSPRAMRRADPTFRVLFIGQIGQRKGVGYLLRAYQQFRRADTQLHLVGDYVSGSIEAFRPYADLFKHTGNVPQQELPSVFHQADVFVLPSLIEGMPLVVLEAMACGVPVITTTHGACDILRDGVDGYFVPIRDSQAIAERLERLYRDRELCEQMGCNARTQAQCYTWDVYARRSADAVLAQDDPLPRAST
jgi:glycosyltransferase involved in cell wall biosynthesis